MVNIGNIMIPIKERPITDAVVATRWAFDGEVLVLYEFTIGSRQVWMNQRCDFVRGLGKIIEPCNGRSIEASC